MTHPSIGIVCRRREQTLPILLVALIFANHAVAVTASASADNEDEKTRRMLRDAEGSGRQLFGWSILWELIHAPHGHGSGSGSGSSGGRSGGSSGSGSGSGSGNRTYNDEEGGGRMSIAALSALIIGAVLVAASIVVFIVARSRRNKEDDEPHPLDGGVSRKMALLDSDNAGGDLESIAAATAATRAETVSPTIIEINPSEDGEGDSDSDNHVEI